ncbi:TEF transcription factor, PAR bZIP family member b [Megalops cyprinoides]|uniref:TEF transcription factor, PAR bZIP family member b n=1 Tax=Megalops cyprinoides TaxID=118141 RepID=UPI0018641305|nr:TEF transcription factor, PAR bZIP family member b [Megalops cyprinoides]
MPVETTTTVAPEPRSDAQRSFPFVLKKIMDIPPPNILEDGDDEKDKEKLCSENDGESGGGGGSAGAGGVSASLTPAIWEKTIPYDGETFHLEYMDLDEFLLENGIPASLEEELQKNLSKEHAKGEAPVPLLSSVELDQGVEEEEADTVSESTSEVPTKVVTEKSKELERATPSPVNPEDIDVDVNFQPDPTDLVLSSVPGGELFNPRKHRFSDDELKPQPMIKKAKKVFVPEEQKDDKYWQRRKKNNVAAKRSRDARRLKENQITVRAAFLERENAALRQEVAELRKDCGRCKNLLTRYQAKYGPL